MLEADLHVHSLFTLDAFNTAYEMIDEARQKGVKIIGICDHSPVVDVAPDIPGHYTIEHYVSSRRRRVQVGGVELIWGVEVEILNDKGELDPKMTEEVLKKQDLVIASFHGKDCLKPGIRKKIGGKPRAFKAMFAAMENPLVDVIGHPFLKLRDDEIKAIVDQSVGQNIPLELNNAYLIPPKSSAAYQARAILMTKLLKERRGKIFVSSDAHIAWELGGDEGIKAVLKKAKFDTKNIVNWTPKQANEFLAHRRRNA